MNQGINLLAPNRENQDMHITKLLNNFNIEVPPIYKVFIESFDLTSLKRLYFRYEDKGLYPFTSNYYTPIIDLGITSFVKIEDNVEILSDVDNEVRERNFLFVAGCTKYSGGGVMVGTRNEDKDKIFLDKDDDSDSRFELVAENIFEFVNGMESKVIEKEYISYNVDPSNLYKNFREDFYRIKESI